MTGPQHFTEAIRLLMEPGCEYRCPHSGCVHEMRMIARAQAHFTAAAAAATALAASPGGMPKMDYAEWRQVAGRQTEAEAEHERIGGQP